MTKKDFLKKKRKKKINIEAQFIINLIGKKFKPNKATLEARELNKQIKNLKQEINI